MNIYHFHYIITGDRTKPVILFLHGFMGSVADFAGVAEQLENDFCCLLLDLPEHGKTGTWQSNYGMSDVAHAIIALLEQLSIPRCFLVGYSLGGRLALYLAVHFPQYFLKVVIESASPGLKTQLERDLRLERDEKLASKLETEDFTSFLEQWYQNPLFASFVAHPNYQQAIAKRADNDPSLLAKSLRQLGLGRQPSLWDDLANLSVTVLAIVGELDVKFVAINQKINLLSPQIKLNIVKNAGHNVHFERSTQFAFILRFYLTKNNHSC